MPSLAGGLGPPVLGGFLLDGAAVSEQDLTVRTAKEVVTLAHGGRREAWAFQGAGYPLVGRKYDLTLRYQNLGPHIDLVEQLLSLPGPHDVVVWKRVPPSFAGDGVRAEFSLPWRVATDVYSSLIPPGLQTGAGHLQPSATIGLGGGAVELAVSVVDSGTYAGTPPSGEAWILAGGQTIKVGTVPDAGEFLHVLLVPVLAMFEGAPDVSKRYPAATPREPRDIVLMEQ